jgi:hypothetical protein
MIYSKLSFPAVCGLALSIAAPAIIACSAPAERPGTHSGSGGSPSGISGSAGDAAGAQTTAGSVATSGSAAGGSPGTAGSETGGPATGGSAGAASDGPGGSTNGGSAGMPTAGTGMGGVSGVGGMATGGGSSGQGGTAAGGSAGMPAGGADNLNSGPNTMGWIGCSMGENTAAGYRRIGGTRMWGGYGNGGAVVQQWTSDSGAAWRRFRDQTNMHGKPVAVWIMICIFARDGANAQEVNQMIAHARANSAPGVKIYLTGQPLYDQGHTCTLAGANGPESTDQLAQTVAAQHADVTYPGPLRLRAGEVATDTCHANTQGQDSLGRQARAFWGQP